MVFDSPKYPHVMKLRAFYAVPKMVVIPSGPPRRHLLHLLHRHYRHHFHTPSTTTTLTIAAITATSSSRHLAR